MQSPPQRKSKSATRARDHDHHRHRSDLASRDYHGRDRDIVVDDDRLGHSDSNNDLEDFNFSSFSSPRCVCM